jgi:hypothetical protein
MHLSFQKKYGCYVVRFSDEKATFRENKNNAIIYFNKNNSIIGFDVLPHKKYESYQFLNIKFKNGDFLGQIDWDRTP